MYRTGTGNCAESLQFSGQHFGSNREQDRNFVLFFGRLFYYSIPTGNDIKRYKLRTISRMKTSSNGKFFCEESPYDAEF